MCLIKINLIIVCINTLFVSKVILEMYYIKMRIAHELRAVLVIDTQFLMIIILNYLIHGWVKKFKYLFYYFYNRILVYELEF